MPENTRNQPDPMAHKCPACAAEPNQPCRTRGGRETDPHVRRLLLVDEWEQQRALRRVSRVRALCCECGNLRTTSAGYRKNDDNLTCDDNLHPLGWRCTQTLKCAICRIPTRHAVLRDNCEPRFRDIAETRMHLKTGAGVPPLSYRYLMGDGTESQL
jgi:hypothetical protein